MNADPQIQARRLSDHAAWRFLWVFASVLSLLCCLVLVPCGFWVTAGILLCFKFFPGRNRNALWVLARCIGVGRRSLSPLSFGRRIVLMIGGVLPIVLLMHNREGDSFLRLTSPALNLAVVMFSLLLPLTGWVYLMASPRTDTGMKAGRIDKVTACAYGFALILFVPVAILSVPVAGAILYDHSDLYEDNLQWMYTADSIQPAAPLPLPVQVYRIRRRPNNPYSEDNFLVRQEQHLLPGLIRTTVLYKGGVLKITPVDAHHIRWEFTDSESRNPQLPTTIIQTIR